MGPAHQVEMKEAEMAQRKQVERTFEVTNGSGRTYTVKLFTDGTAFCTCPAWKFQKKHADARICKHIVKVRNAEATPAWAQMTIEGIERTA